MYLIVLSFLLLLPCIISVCPLFFTLVFSSLFWLSAHKVTNHFCVPLFCHLYSAIMLYIQFLSRFVLNPPQPPTTLQIFPALFSRCDYHGLVFSFFLSPLLSTIVLIVSHVLHVRLEDTRHLFSSFIISLTRSTLCVKLCLCLWINFMRIAPSLLKIFSLSLRLRDPWTQDHPQRCGVEGVSDAQGVCG